MDKHRSLLFERWGITEQELTDLVDANPSLRGIMLGYVAEKKFHDIYLGHPAITEKGKDDDHDRKKKGDRHIIYKNKRLVIEIKSLQTEMVAQIGEDEWTGRTQVDASDRRIVKFPDGTELNTTLLLRGEFDLLAVNCFAFGNQWRFVFAKNSDLPCSTFKKYTQAQREGLIASLIPITWPPKPPFTDNPFTLLDQLAAHPDKSLEISATTEAIITDQPVIEVKPLT